MMKKYETPEETVYEFCRNGSSFSFEVRLVRGDGKTVIYRYDAEDFDDMVSEWSLTPEEVEKVRSLKSGERIYLGEIGPDSLYVGRCWQ